MFSRPISSLASSLLVGVFALLAGTTGCDRSGSGRDTQTNALVSASGAITNAADELRTGWYPDQAGLDPALVGGPTFGRLFNVALPLSGGEQVFAQPLVIDGTVFVATEANDIYALDGETGQVKASRNVGTPWNASDIGCGDLTPTIGITGTPVIDAKSRTAYFFSKTYRDGNAAWYAHAVDVDTLDERGGFPVLVQGTAANDPSITFDAYPEMQRPGLLLMNGVVYAGFGGHCDIGSYRGWLVGIGTDGSIRTLFATEAGPQKAKGAGIWQSGGGLVSDGNGRIFFATGNGYSNAQTAPTPGSNPPPTLDESLARVEVQGDGSLRATDFFTPYDVRSLDDADLDFGSGGPLALPSQHFGTTAIPNLMVMGGKEGLLFLVNRDNLGGFQQGNNNGDAVVARVNADGGLWSRPSVWPGDGGYVYVVSNSTRLQAFKYGLDGGGKPSLSLAGRSSDYFGYTSGSPIVTSDGTKPGSALVWVTLTTGSYGQGQLLAYDAVPDGGGTLALRFQDSYGTHAKFSVPGVGAGRIYVGTADGHLIGYGSPKKTPVSGDALDFGKVTTNSAKTLTAVITANQDLTVTALDSSAAAFSLGSPSLALPATLTAGQTLTVPVTFTPTESKLYAAALNVSTSAGSGALTLKGTGQVSGPQISAAPSAISFGGLAVGASKTVNVVLSNGGTDPLTFGVITAPDAPFVATGLPAVGQTLAAGASLTVSVQFAPTAAGTFNDDLTFASDGGTLSIFLSGSANTQGTLVISPLSLDFGNVAAGSTKSLTFTLTNNGNTDLTVTKSKPPSLGVFVAKTALDEGTVVPANSSVTETVEFAPKADGSFSDQWVVTANDGNGVQTVSFQGTSGGGGLSVTYYDNMDFTGATVTQTVATVDFDWGEGSPASGIGVDSFSARWTGTVKPTSSETYTFYTLSDDGIRLWVNGQLVIDNWTDHPPTENSGTIALQAGQSYDLKLEFYENGGGAVARLYWSTPSIAKQVVPASALGGGSGGTSGLAATYYDNMDFTGATVTQTVATVDFDWGEGSPASGIGVDSFSARWTGTVKPTTSETYTFYTLSDDGIRLWVNGQLVIDNWTDHPPTENSGTIALQAGQSYDLKLEFYENGGGAVARLYWSTPSIAKQVVPASALSH